MRLSKSGAALLSVLSNGILIVVKVIVGLLTGSVSIIAEAVHSLIDLVAAVIAWVGVRIADKPADDSHEFGHGKVENVSGTVQAILIFMASGLIIYEAVDKIIHGESIVMTELGIGVMAISVLTNFGVGRVLTRIARKSDSLALEADAKHLNADVYTSLGVFAGLVLIRFTGWVILDPIIAIGVALFICKTAWTSPESRSAVSWTRSYLPQRKRKSRHPSWNTATASLASTSCGRARPAASATWTSISSWRKT